jgi:isochorismate synthase
VPDHELDHRAALKGAALIDELLRRGVTFAAFRSPGAHALVYIQHGQDLHPPHAGQRCFVLAPFEAEDGPAVGLRPDKIVALESNHSILLEFGEGHSKPSADLVPGLDRPGYRQAVRAAINAIQAGELQKVVLARTVATSFAGTTPGTLFTAAIETLPTAFVAIASTHRFGIWMGASPERLVHKRGNRVEVDAIAGTQPSERALQQPADWGLKERAEQSIVTRSVMATLTSQGVQALKAADPEVRVAGNVAHLHTRISGQAAEINALDLAQALHPTPAVGGFPTMNALDMIRSLEPRRRSLYAGYWGPLYEEDADLFVNIRCMEVVEEQALVHAGAGITVDSDPDRECDEVERKARTWLDLIDAQRRHG